MDQNLGKELKRENVGVRKDHPKKGKQKEEEREIREIWKTKQQTHPIHKNP